MCRERGDPGSLAVCPRKECMCFRHRATCPSRSCQHRVLGPEEGVPSYPKTQFPCDKHLPRPWTRFTMPWPQPARIAPAWALLFSPTFPLPLIPPPIKDPKLGSQDMCTTLCNTEPEPYNPMSSPLLKAQRLNSLSNHNSGKAHASSSSLCPLLLSRRISGQTGH